MIQIALSRVFLERWGEQIITVAPEQIQLLGVDDPADEAWRDAEIFINSEFANGKTATELVGKMPRLRWLHSIYAGTDDIPWELVNARGIIVTNSAGVYAPMMAEYVIAMLVVHYRNLDKHIRAQSEHRPQAARSLEETSGELFGKRMGILGYGAIGRRIAHVASAMGMRVCAMRRTPTVAANEPVERMLGAKDLELLLRECEIIVVTASLNSTTRSLIGKAELEWMKPGAVLVNVARGAIVDEAELARALERGQIGGAILDVTTEEPLPMASPLWSAPNLLLTPHISGEMPVGRERSMDLFCQNLQLYLDGQREFFGNRVRSETHT